MFLNLAMTLNFCLCIVDSINFTISISFLPRTPGSDLDFYVFVTSFYMYLWYRYGQKKAKFNDYYIYGACLVSFYRCIIVQGSFIGGFWGVIFFFDVRLGCPHFDLVIAIPIFFRKIKYENFRENNFLPLIFFWFVLIMKVVGQNSIFNCRSSENIDVCDESRGYSSRVSLTEYMYFFF